MIRPTLLAALSAALLASVVTAQASNQDRLIKQRDEKLAKPVFQNAAWRTDYDAARAEAQKDGKLILTYFTRSYAG